MCPEIDLASLRCTEQCTFKEIVSRDFSLDILFNFITCGMIIPPGITSSWTTNPFEKWQIGKIKMLEKSSEQ
jgi:hypothetical protein